VLLFGLSHLGWERRDDSALWMLSGRPVDLWGRAQDAWVRAQRDCRAVSVGPLDGAQAASVLAQVRAYSPPDSASARLRTLQALGPWQVAEFEFDRLEPVAVVFHEGRLLPASVWSGPTEPWWPAWRIRRFWQQRVPELPPTLAQCTDPGPWFLKPPLNPMGG